MVYLYPEKVGILKQHKTKNKCIWAFKFYGNWANATSGKKKLLLNTLTSKPWLMLLYGQLLSFYDDIHFSKINYDLKGYEKSH